MNQRDNYIQYLIYRFVNRVFWIIQIISLIIGMIIDISWSHNGISILVLSEVAIMLIVQKVLKKTSLKANAPSIEFKSVEITDFQNRIQILNFKSVECFIVISIAIWIGMLLFPKITLVTKTTTLLIAIFALESVFMIFTIILSSIYYSLKN